MLEFGRRLFPRRYRRFKDLRPRSEAIAWAQDLDWRNNPYDRFLLRREILHHLESTLFYEPDCNVYTFASRKEIAAEVDFLLNDFPEDDIWGWMGVFGYVVRLLPWHIAIKHGKATRSRLEEALESLEKRREPR
jgi:hypothetical protein